jgi:hypothetical protein
MVSSFRVGNAALAPSAFDQNFTIFDSHSHGSLYALAEFFANRTIDRIQGAYKRPTNYHKYFTHLISIQFLRLSEGGRFIYAKCGTGGNIGKLAPLD